jgi:glyoxylase-like metal-dependent hydrolase (beta-lactamase superfamily II)
MSLKKMVSTGASILAFTTSTAFGQTPMWTNERSINQITEHVYRFGATQNAMFIVTSAGIILVDGSCDNMEWLKSELKRRFNQLVKYAVMSHDHQSHICDMDVFADTAVGIGHVNILPHILREKRKTIIPQILFEHRIEIELGGMKVVLLYLGPTHSDNLIYVHVPSEGVMFAPDFGRGRNILPDFRDLDVHNSLKALTTLSLLPDVKIVLEGHDKFTQTQQQAFLEFRRYLQAVRDRVLERMVAGKSLSEIRQEVTMSDFKEFNQSPQRVVVQVETMFDYLWRYREPTVGGPQVPVRAPRD